MTLTENCDKEDENKTKREITKRGLILAILLNVLYTLINSYLGLNFGMGLRFSLVTILLAYTLFHVVMGSSSKQEITTIVTASSGFTAWWIIATSIYIRVMEPETNLPTWLAPPLKVLIEREHVFTRMDNTNTCKHLSHNCSKLTRANNRDHCCGRCSQK